MERDPNAVLKITSKNLITLQIAKFENQIIQI